MTVPTDIVTILSSSLRDAHIRCWVQHLFLQVVRGPWACPFASASQPGTSAILTTQKRRLHSNIQRHVHIHNTEPANRTALQAENRSVREII